MFKFDGLKRLIIKYDVSRINSTLSFSTQQNLDRIDKILIANRGEIACRIVRTAKKLGIKTVAVYSDVDRGSLHVQKSDEAYCIGLAPSSQSYLQQDKIIQVAKESKCQAIHPGYGFLSENAEFAELCQKKNIIFIGPPSLAIKNMGIKSTSKIIMKEANVPVIDGYHGNDQSNKTLIQEAKQIGYPLMIKAVRGGGGKGMRIAYKEEEFIEALESARTESSKSFGDSVVLLEQYITEPRHVEVQIFADKFGNVVYLFERDCSVQRRHQKIIEEAPAPGISEKVRKELGEAAVRAAKAVGYIGAGTVEFIFDRSKNSFYFMEMNTRLQVEHPITEAITGTDLVEWQLKIAAGEQLHLKQDEIKLNGHAFEARINAEDPRNEFLPGAGKLSYLDTPQTDGKVRVETGIRLNDEVSVHYDPMIAKLITWGSTRDEALNLLHANLTKYHIAGLETNIEFLKDICKHPKFRNGDVHTGFIEENYDELFPKVSIPAEIIVEAALALILHDELQGITKATYLDDPFNPFILENGLRLNHSLKKSCEFLFGQEIHSVEIKYEESDLYSMRVNDIGPWRKATGSLKIQDDMTTLEVEIDGVYKQTKILKTKTELFLFTNDKKWHFTIPKPKYMNEMLDKSNSSNTGAAVSPMPGLVDKILVKEGDEVKAGDSMVVVVAMKMEYPIKATRDGVVEKVLCSVGENVAKDKLMIKFQQD